MAKKPPAFERMDIVVVQDRASHLKLAHVVLGSPGERDSEARIVERAFEAIKKRNPELILLEVEFPAADSLALVRKLKAAPATRGTPIVVLTPYPDQFTRAEALAAGCDAYVIKPGCGPALPGRTARAAARTHQAQL